MGIAVYFVLMVMLSVHRSRRVIVDVVHLNINSIRFIIEVIFHPEGHKSRRIHEHTNLPYMWLFTGKARD